MATHISPESILLLFLLINQQHYVILCFIVSSCCKTKPLEKTVSLIPLFIHFYPPELHKVVLKMQLITIHSINSRQQYFSRLCWILFKFQGYICTFLRLLILPPTVFQVKKKWTTITKKRTDKFWNISKVFQVPFFSNHNYCPSPGKDGLILLKKYLSDFDSPWAEILGKYKAVHAITVGSPVWLLLWLF